MLGEVQSNYDLSGDQSYKTLAQRNAHPILERKQRVQLFYVEETEKVYQLIGGITNAHWQEYKTVAALPTPFRVKQAMPLGDVVHDGTVEGFLQAGFAPFLPPTISLSTNPAAIEVGMNTGVALNGLLNARGEETTFSELRIVRDTQLIAELAAGNSLALSDILSPTAETAFAYTFSAKYTGGGKVNEPFSTNRTVNAKFPYLFGLSSNAGLTVADVISAVAGHRAMLNSNTFNVNVNTASGNHIYIVIPSGKTISSIADNNDNGAAVPLSTLTLVSSGVFSLTNANSGVDVAYTMQAKVYRTGALGAANFNWKINL